MRSNFTESINEALGCLIDLGIGIVKYVGCCALIRVLRAQINMFTVVAEVILFQIDALLIRIDAESGVDGRLVFVFIEAVRHELLARCLLLLAALLHIRWRFD